MESGNRSATALWIGLAAVATGVVAATLVARWKAKIAADASVHHQLRDVQEVLSDCYKKISEIEQHLPELVDDQRNTVLHRLSNQMR